ncbi:MAG: phosphoribosyl-AMP cyclohydrolase [Pseudomonadota bacterium]
MKHFLLGVSAIGLAACAHAEKTVADVEIGVTKAEVLAAQKAWGDGIVAIAAVHESGGDYESRARDHIDTLYAYGESAVMFKPTLAADDQFRESFDEALAYFIGKEGTEDKGFAISGWTNVRWDDVLVFTDTDSAMSMGNYFFTGPDGSETKVEFSFGYIADEDGDLKINLHHSSLPYAP